LTLPWPSRTFQAVFRQFPPLPYRFPYAWTPGSGSQLGRAVYRGSLTPRSAHSGHRTHSFTSTAPASGEGRSPWWDRGRFMSYQPGDGCCRRSCWWREWEDTGMEGELVKPACVQAGDTVAVVSPCSPVVFWWRHRAEWGLAYLESLGLNVRVMPNSGATKAGAPLAAVPSGGPPRGVLGPGRHGRVGGHCRRPCGRTATSPRLSL
jgi:hypothetical protein